MCKASFCFCRQRLQTGCHNKLSLETLVSAGAVLRKRLGLVINGNPTTAAALTETCVFSEPCFSTRIRNWKILVWQVFGKAVGVVFQVPPEIFSTALPSLFKRNEMQALGHMWQELIVRTPDAVEI